MNSNKFILTILLALGAFCFEANAQAIRSGFWDRVDVGGGFGLNFGNDFFSLNVAPSAVYNFNPNFAIGPGLSYSYIKNGNFKSSIAGASLIALFNTLEVVQLSAELEELYVNQTQELDGGNRSRDFWNTALFLGAGYRTGAVTIGARYNVLYNDNNQVYSSAIQPFIRVYF